MDEAQTINCYTVDLFTITAFVPKYLDVCSCKEYVFGTIKPFYADENDVIWSSAILSHFGQMKLML